MIEVEICSKCSSSASIEYRPAQWHYQPGLQRAAGTAVWDIQQNSSIEGTTQIGNTEYMQTCAAQHGTAGGCVDKG